jgi:hypothetical protein
LVPALPDTAQRRESELDLQIALGQALITGRFRDVPGLAEAYSRAGELAWALNRPRALLSILWGQCLNDWAQGDLQQAERRTAELRELGETNADAPMQVVGCNAGGFSCLLLGAFTTARAYFEKALALYDPADRASYAEVLPTDERVFHQGHLSLALACIWRRRQALGGFMPKSRRPFELGDSRIERVVLVVRRAEPPAPVPLALALRERNIRISVSRARDPVTPPIPAAESIPDSRIEGAI